MSNRRINLAERKKLRNPDRHIRALEKWADGFKGYWPSTEEFDQRGWWYEKIPILQKAVSPPHTTASLQKRAANALLLAISHIENARPKTEKSIQTYAYVTWPDMFDSMIELARNPNPYLIINGDISFGDPKSRGREWQVVYECNESLVDRLGLQVPESFNILGKRVEYFDPSYMQEPEMCEHWAFGKFQV